MRYLPIGVPTLELIAKSRAVATITGTAGWEALQMGKPVICFGYAWYRSFPGVFRWDGLGIQTISDALNFTFDKEALRGALDIFKHRLWPGDVSLIEYDEKYTEQDAAAKRMASLLTYLRLIDEGSHHKAHAETFAAAHAS